MSEQGSRQELPEGGDGVADEILYIYQRFQERFTLDNPRLIERYANGEALLLVHFHVDGYREKFVAHFQRSPMRGLKENGGHCGPRGSHSFGGAAKPILWNVPSDIDADATCIRQAQEMMLFGITQSVELPERVPLSSLPRFGCAKCVYNAVPRMLCYSAYGGWEMRGKVTDGELDILRLRLRSAFRERELIDDLVERAPEILDYVGGDCLHRYREGIDLRQIEDALLALRIFFVGDRIRVSLEERGESQLQIDDVLFGPCDFRADSLQHLAHA